MSLHMMEKPARLQCNICAVCFAFILDFFSIISKQFLEQGLSDNVYVGSVPCHGAFPLDSGLYKLWSVNPNIAMKACIVLWFRKLLAKLVFAVPDKQPRLKIVKVSGGLLYMGCVHLSRSQPALLTLGSCCYLRLYCSLLILFLKGKTHTCCSQFLAFLGIGDNFFASLVAIVIWLSGQTVWVVQLCLQAADITR